MLDWDKTIGNIPMKYKC